MPSVTVSGTSSGANQGAEVTHPSVHHRPSTLSENADGTATLIRFPKGQKTARRKPTPPPSRQSLPVDLKKFAMHGRDFRKVKRLQPTAIVSNRTLDGQLTLHDVE